MEVVEMHQIKVLAVAVVAQQQLELVPLQVQLMEYLAVLEQLLL
tara:strand:- start:161 stop:292 length:132 start_codon:yes stop_codon:yes gene_type:complete